jgi:CheY-like chemotaxis protein
MIMTKKILVVDDDSSVCQAFLLALEDADYQVDIAESGEVGLEKYKGGQYDLIFLDLKMPGINGTEVLKGIRKDNRDVPIYVVTAFHKEFFKDLLAIKKAGMAFDLLDKPVGSEQIIAVVEGVFGL